MVDGAALEKRCAKAPWVRIPPSPPPLLRIPVEDAPAGWVRAGERSPSGLWRRTGNAVRGNPSRVRIPPSPPPLLDCDGRARRGTSGALYLQSAPAGLNPLPRSPLSDAAISGDVEGRVPRSDDSRTVSGPEGSSTKRTSPGAADRPGPSRTWWWARERAGRRRVHGTPARVGRASRHRPPSSAARAVPPAPGAS